MNKNLFNLNNAIVGILKRHYMLLHCFAYIKPGDESKFDAEAFRLFYEAEMIFGHWGELWDGQPNAYILLEEIEKLQTKYHVTDDEYDEFYLLTPTKRVDALANLFGEIQSDDK